MKLRTQTILFYVATAALAANLLLLGSGFAQGVIL